MPSFIDNIDLSNELKQEPIAELIVKAKSLVRARGYSQSTIWHYNERFNDLQQMSKLFKMEKLSKEFVALYIEEGLGRSPRLTSSGIQRKALLNLIAAAVNTTPVYSFEKDAEKIQFGSFQNNLNNYERYLREQGKRKETIKSSIQIAAKFLLYLEKAKKYDLSKVTPTEIREFITDLGARWSPRSMRIVPSHLRTYMKFAGFSAEAILYSSFRTPRRSNPIRAMSCENIKALWEYVKSDVGDLRSKAIVSILLATGMRPVDISKLDLNDIDWHNDSISFIQSKTGEGMNIKLFPVLGSTILRYITEERPKGTSLKAIFLSKRAPYRRLAPTVCNYVLRDALEKAGSTFEGDGLHCPRAVRRSLVSRMIEKGVPIQKAAAAIGHVDEKSVDLYTELDVKKMRSICLPIPKPMKIWRPA